MADATVAVDPTTLHHGQMHHTAAPVDLLALVQAYRTNILVLDALLCLLVPILIQQLIMLLQDGDKSQTLLPMLWRWLRGNDQWIERTIEVTERYTRDGYRDSDYDQPNYLLQKAISLFLSDVVTFEKEDAKFELFTKPKDPKLDDDGDEGTDEASTDDSDDEYSYSHREDVSRLAVKTLPLLDTYIEVEKGVLFKHKKVEGHRAGESRTGKETKVIFKFASKRRDGSARIEALIQKAYANYQALERAKIKEDSKRYFYIQSGTKSVGEDANSKQVVAYKRYALGEEKTFENLFFDQKDAVLSLLNNFADKTGKFSIKGFPYKLGFLLHGPPGTGKTSLIKAIAHHTKRHIVTINLAMIKTNQELMDAIFDLKFAVNGLDSPVEYSFKDVIFVMEDIDCASSIVNKREKEGNMAGEGDGLSEAATNALLNNIVAAAEASSSPSQEKSSSSTSSSLKEDAMSASTEPKTEEEKLMQMMLKMVKDDDKKSSSELNLAGLLNVLDGVIDCPGRIIVMTTNHPEKLDPALIRPGRINKKLLLSYMNATQVSQMIEYYTQSKLGSGHMERLEKVFALDEKLVSPAEVEEMCAEYDSTEKIIEGLEQVAFASRFLRIIQ